MTRAMISILATGFGAFPGVKDNPSATLMHALMAQRDRFARLGIGLEVRILPVIYDGLAERLTALTNETAPEAILHFGVATRRKMISVEMRARNLRHPRATDAQGARPESSVIERHGPETIPVRIPAAQIAAKMRRAGIAAELSRDAGRYLCNAALYETLRARPRTPVGFIHIPLPDHHGVPDFADIVAAADIAIIAVAGYVRQTQSLSRYDAAHRIWQDNPAHG